MQADLKAVRNAMAPDFPSYLMLNPNYKIRASSNPRELLSTGTEMPGTISVGALKDLSRQGRSPLRTAA